MGENIFGNVARRDNSLSPLETGQPPHGWDLVVVCINDYNSNYFNHFRLSNTKMHYSNGNMNAEINIKNNKIILYGKTILT